MKYEAIKKESKSPNLVDRLGLCCLQDGGPKGRGGASVKTCRGGDVGGVGALLSKSQKHLERRKCFFQQLNEISKSHISMPIKLQDTLSIFTVSF